MMQRFLLAGLGLFALTGALLLQAGEPTTPAPRADDSSAKVKEKLSLEEQILSNRFQDFEQKLLKLKQRLERSSRQEDRDRAVILGKALDKAREASIGTRFEQMVDIVRTSRLNSITDLQTAQQRSEQLADDLRAILALLRENTQDVERHKNLKELERLKKEIDRLIREQKSTQARTQIGRSDPRELKNNQAQIANDTKKVGQDMGKHGQKGGEAKNSKGDTKDAGKGKGKQGEGKDAGKSAEDKAAQGKDGGKSGEGKPAEAKGGQGKQGQEAKAGSKSGQAKDGGDSKSGQAKSGEAKAGEPKAGQAGAKSAPGKQGQQAQAKAGEPKSGQAGAKKGGGEPKAGQGSKSGQGQAKAGSKGSPSQAKAGQGSKSGQGQQAQSQSKSGSQQSQQAKAKAGQSQSGQGQSKSGGQQQAQANPKGDNQPQPPPQQAQNDLSKAQKRIQEAYEKERNAEDKIEQKKNPEATQDQEQAIKNLEAARKRLEELLRQMREEELERILADLQARCERMLRMQIRVYEGTLIVHKGITEAEKGKKDKRGFEQDSLKLSDEEKNIVLEASKAIQILEDEGSAVAFPEVFVQVREDMRNVQKRLGVVDTGKITQTTEEDIIATLRDMIKALEKAKQDLAKSKSKPGQSGPPPDQKLLDQIAELKMIRAMQIRVNNRTQLYGRQYEGEQAADTNLRREIHQLSDRQERIFDVTNRIVRGDNR